MLLYTLNLVVKYAMDVNQEIIGVTANVSEPRLGAITLEMCIFERWQWITTSMQEDVPRLK